jgi:hypothetical protein
MPIERYNQSSPPIDEPSKNTEMVRYVDITKFISILKDRSLFFCRMDKLQDKFEGTFPLSTRQAIINSTREARDHGVLEQDLSDDTIEKSANVRLSYQDRLRSVNCINCWNEFNGESYALWKIYAGMNNGMMLKTRFGKLIHAFRDTTERVYCSKVSYIDHKKDSIDFGNSILPIIHKHNAYSYENEIRLIHEVGDPNTYDWSNSAFTNGVMIAIDINDFIDEIIISPFSPIWFKSMIQDLINKYSFGCNVSDSDLS